MRARGAFLLIVALFGVGRSIGAESEGVLNRLLAPGPLIGDHSDLEGSDCLKCHVAGEGVPNSKCLDCHKEIRPFVTDKRGFHGLQDKACIECHKDHKGREFDSTQFEWKTFDHGVKTGYKLEGKHAEIKCEECHKEKRVKRTIRPNDPKFIGKISTCVSCHRKDDVHKFVGEFAKKDCNACHGLKSWKDDLRFDHGKDANYKLIGKHAKVSCNECHLANKQKKLFHYKWPNLKQKQCLSCHEDFHKNKLSDRFRGGNCVKCHDQEDWKIETFKHDVTGFVLKFKHFEARCIDCHKQKGLDANKYDAKRSPLKNFNFAGLKKACLSCHEDFHRFAGHKSKSLGDLNQCLKCHDESEWKKIHDFDHNRNTHYGLDGEHLDLKCNACHVPTLVKGKKQAPPNVGRYGWPHLEQKTCENCHANPHVGQFKKELLQKKCSVCHATEGWMVMKSGKGFDHNKTRFVLDGAHKSAKCSACHVVDKKQIFKFASFDQKFCKDCHENVHKGQFSEKFVGQGCATCHTTQNFTERLAKFDHGQTRYSLEGSHQDVKCVDCHKPSKDRFALRRPNFSAKDIASFRVAFKSQFLFQTRECLSCHQDYHKGQLSKNCQECHAIKKWKDTRFDHNKQSAFQLIEKHADVACNKCHIPSKTDFVAFYKDRRPFIRYKPLSQQCVDCHKDPHKGNFGRKCQECHTVREWKITKDFHRNFNLTGVHFTLECAECHYDGKKLAGLGQQCLFCHQKDDVHNGTLSNCKDCHTQHFWEVSRFKHSLTRFPLRGAHRTLDCIECHYQGGSRAMYQGLDSRCETCHLRDATAATSFDHVLNGALSNCTNCHRNQFSFSN